MRGFAVFLILLWFGLLAYTLQVIAAHGLGLLPIFFGAIGRGDWPGQFNLDFLLMLMLSATWVAWRGGFRPAALALALLAFFGGAGFLLPYLALLCWRHPADPATVLTGPRRRDR